MRAFSPTTQKKICVLFSGFVVRTSYLFRSHFLWAFEAILSGIVLLLFTSLFFNISSTFSCHRLQCLPLFSRILKKHIHICSWKQRTITVAFRVANLLKTRARVLKKTRAFLGLKTSERQRTAAEHLLFRVDMLKCMTTMGGGGESIPRC